MNALPQPGEVWFVDLGFVGKPRYALVLAARADARLALASVVLITTQFEGTPYEVTLPRVPWLREQSYLNTLVIFTSDNGANKEFIETLASTGGLRGFKRMLYEGGILTPFIARWPGKIPPDTTSDLLTSSMDLLPTAAELAGVPVPPATDGISILPTLLGKNQVAKHEALYFEIYEPYFQQSVRRGDWKGYRLGTKAPLELYDLKSDPAEKDNLASNHPDIVGKIEGIMAVEHTPSQHYDAPEQFKKRAEASEKKSGGAEL